MIVSPGRLVWEKGHYDVIRAVAVLAERGRDVRLAIVGAGPERARLLRYADDLGVGDRVEIRTVPYDEMPAVFGSASCVVLASLPIPSWEEQFGLVLRKRWPRAHRSSRARRARFRRCSRDPERPSSRRETGQSSRASSTKGRLRPRPGARELRRARSSTGSRPALRPNGSPRRTRGCSTFAARHSG